MCSSPTNNGTAGSIHEKIKIGPTEIEIQEWYMELRKKLCLYGWIYSDVRMEKMKDLENVEAERGQDRDRISV